MAGLHQSNALRGLLILIIAHQAADAVVGVEEFAQAAVMQPDVMILDEATAMLDPSGREEVFSTVRKLNREKGITVVWITHFMEEAAKADRVVVLDHGAVAMDGTPREVFARVQELKSLGLDVPPMAELSRMLGESGLPLPAGILTVDDMVKELKQCLFR